MSRLLWRHNGLLPSPGRHLVDADPRALTLEELVGTTHANEAICVRQQVVKIVDRPQDIDDEEAMIFFGGDMGDAEKSTG
jgi:hypothetical protein